MSAHTPGPWTLQPIGDETECNILGAGRELIATVSGNDARLIAAAPRMLAALTEIAQLHRHHDVSRAKEIARAAIAQAKGK